MVPVARRVLVTALLMVLVRILAAVLPRRASLTGLDRSYTTVDPGTLTISLRTLVISMTAVMEAFGAIVSEVGTSMIVGGNLERSTRVLMTAIVTETSGGEVERALSLGRRPLRAIPGRQHHVDCGSATESPLMDVRLTDLRFTRTGREVLPIPGLDIRAGRTTAVLGPNGAGETTLLRLVPLSRTATPPRAGDRVVIHASIAYDLLD